MFEKMMRECGVVSLSTSSAMKAAREIICQMPARRKTDILPAPMMPTFAPSPLVFEMIVREMKKNVLKSVTSSPFRCRSPGTAQKSPAKKRLTATK